MGKNSVVDLIAEKVMQSNISELAIIMNGRYLMHSGKLVYVSCSMDSSVPVSRFYVKDSDPITSSYRKKEVGNAENEIMSVLGSNVLYGVALDGRADIQKCTVDVCVYNRLLVIESQLYAAVKKIVGSENQNVSFVFDNNIVPVEKINHLKEAFIRQAYINYGELIYSKKNGRFTNKLFKANKFYAIQKAFVPVFINYQKVFNPFELEGSVVKSTSLYQKAVKAGRYVESGNISGYFLTHREICEELNMKEFMRFTPAFLYRIFMGLLFPAFDEFPGKRTGDGRHEKLIRGANAEGSFLKHSVLTKEAAAELIEKNRKVLDSPDATMNEKVIAENVLSEIQQFETVDSLFAECIEHHSALVSIGSTVLDRRNATTAEKLYGYVSKASISFGAASGDV